MDKGKYDIKLMMMMTTMMMLNKFKCWNQKHFVLFTLAH